MKDDIKERHNVMWCIIMIIYGLLECIEMGVDA